MGSTPAKKRGRPPTSPEAAELSLISLAFKLAEKQLRDGTASAQVISHFLKLGSQRETLEQKKIEHEIMLLSAKLAATEAGELAAELFEQAIKAMRRYQGDEEEADYDDQDL